MGGLGRTMKLNVMSEQRRTLCLELLKSVCSTKKRVRGDGYLVTEKAEAPVESMVWALMKSIENPDTCSLSKKDAALLIKNVDLSAVVLVDNLDYCWRADVLSLASFLRNQYAKYYGVSAYDEI